MNPEGEYSPEEWANIDQEFSRLRGHHHYLDHAGTTLYSEQQMDSICDDLKRNVYANPHTSKDTEDLIDQVRFQLLQFFNTTSDEYQVIFNRGATDGLKAVAECFDFGPEDGQFLYLKSCHTSVLGMREVVNTPRIIPVEVEDLKAEEKYLNSSSNSLLTFPAQCNFNGFKHDLKLIPRLHQMENSKWHICLDAAAFVGTSFLDLSKFRPDFVVLSFYKIFGYPTGLGALLVSNRGAMALRKRYYGGGTVLIAMSGQNFHRKRPSLQDQFQDGTIPFLSIIALLHGFKTLERLVPPDHHRSSIQRISSHTFRLAKYLFEELRKLKYRNGEPVVELYTQSNYESVELQGGVVNFNVLHSDGNYVGYSEFNCMAEIHNIRLRVGCFCNPGACQRALQLTDEDLMAHYTSGHVCGDAVDLFNNTPTGSVRVSLGYMTGKRDVDALLEMIRRCYLNQVEKIRVDVRTVQGEEEDECKVVLQQICVYPIKSCGPFRVFSQWPLTSRGLKYDREWMVVNLNGVAMTQKQIPQLCLVRPLIDERRGVMRLTARGVDPVEVPLKMDDEGNLSPESISSSLCSKVCGDRVNGFDCGEDVARWLDTLLDSHGLRLIRQDEQEKRFVKTNPETEISLNNAAQFLLINLTSVKWLMSHVDDYSEEMEDQQFIRGIVDRFRGNLIVSTKSPLEEKHWQSINMNGVLLKEAGACTRCQMICVDQESGEKTTEPLRTIGRIFEGKMRFGVYFERDRVISGSSISCGQPIVVEL